MNRIFSTLLTSIGIILATVIMSHADITQTRNFHQFSENVLTSGQPDEQALKSASKDGIQVVINLVRENEGIYNPNEGKIIQSQGIEYHHIPLNWGAPKKETMIKFLKAMNSVGDKKVLVHCWSNARASAMVTAHRISLKPETKAAELETLKPIWKNVAGYDLEQRPAWRKYLDENTGN